MCDTLTQEEVYYLATWLREHRQKAFITCEGTCECWEVAEKIDKALEAMENGRRIKRFRTRKQEKDD